jgi:hypothetical protein
MRSYITRLVLRWKGNTKPVMVDYFHTGIIYRKTNPMYNSKWFIKK